MGERDRENILCLEINYKFKNVDNNKHNQIKKNKSRKFTQAIFIKNLITKIKTLPIFCVQLTHF